MACRDDRVADTESSRVATTNVRPGSDVASSRYWGPGGARWPVTCRVTEPTVMALASGR